MHSPKTGLFWRISTAGTDATTTTTVTVLRRVVLNDAQVTAPGAFRGLMQWRLQAVHVVASITIVAKEQLIIIVRGAAEAAGLALDALPPVLLHREDHVGSELQTGGMRRAAAVRTGDQLFGGVRLLVLR